MFSCIHTVVDLVLYCSAAHKVSYFNAKEKKTTKVHLKANQGR